MPTIIKYLKLFLQFAPLLGDAIKWIRKLIQECKPVKMPDSAPPKEYKRENQKKASSDGHPP